MEMKKAITIHFLIRNMMIKAQTLIHLQVIDMKKTRPIVNNKNAFLNSKKTKEYIVSSKVTTLHTLLKVNLKRQLLEVAGKI
jgi:hypothetical protein